LSALRPIQLAGGEQTLFAITSDGRVYATGWSPEIIFNIKYLIPFLIVRIRSWRSARHRRSRECDCAVTLGIPAARFR
jgi:hypothetical protein